MFIEVTVLTKDKDGVVLEKTLDVNLNMVAFMDAYEQPDEGGNPKDYTRLVIEGVPIIVTEPFDKFKERIKE